MSKETTPTRKRLTREARREVIETAATEVFARHGYAHGSIDEIARRSGVSAPVVYDHFESKRELYRHLLERTRDELLEVWGKHLFGEDPAEVRIPRAIDAWAGYVESKPAAARMYFRDPSGDPEVEADHRAIRDQGRAGLTALMQREAPGIDREAAEMAAEVMRTGLIGLALWWGEHPDVPREKVVATALDAVWLGLERVSRGETWHS